MAKDARERGKKGGSGRATALAGLLAIVALIAVWLNDCIPGLGLGTGEDAPGEAPTQADEATKPAEPEPAPAEPEPAKLEPPKAATVVVDIRGCTITVGDAVPAEPVDCSTLCEAEDPFAGVEQLTIDAKQGPHEAVVALLDCAKQKGIDKLAIERE